MLFKERVVLVLEQFVIRVLLIVVDIIAMVTATRTGGSNKSIVNFLIKSASINSATSSFLINEEVALFIVLSL